MTEWRPGTGRGRGSPGQTIDKLDEVERRYDRLEADLANPETLGDSARLTKVMKERSSLERIVRVYRAFKTVRADLTEAERMLESSDPDERALGKEELPALKERRDALEAELKVLLLPKDPNDEKNVILEIRAGAGGDEAACSPRRSCRCTSATRTEGLEGGDRGHERRERGRRQGRHRHSVRRRASTRR